MMQRSGEPGSLTELLELAGRWRVLGKDRMLVEDSVFGQDPNQIDLLAASIIMLCRLIKSIPRIQPI